MSEIPYVDVIIDVAVFLLGILFGWWAREHDARRLEDERRLARANASRCHECGQYKRPELQAMPPPPPPNTWIRKGIG